MLVLYHHGGWGYLGSDLNAMLLHWLGEFLRGVGMNDKFRCLSHHNPQFSRK
jgi:hypothetical protein